VIESLAKNQTIEIFELISPENFISTKYIPHGTTQYYIQLPKWAKNNPAIVVEKTVLSIGDIKEITIEDASEELLNRLTTQKTKDDIVKTTNKATDILTNVNKTNLVKREDKSTKPKKSTKKTIKRSIIKCKTKKIVKRRKIVKK